VRHPELVVRTDPTPSEIDFLEQRLYEFNRQATGIRDGLGLAIFAHDERGDVIAGLCGSTWGGCCEIRQVWVRESARRAGLGRCLLEKAESEARRRGCFQIMLGTHSFQAPDFYRKLGFELVATIDDQPRGHAHLLMRKRLAPVDAARKDAARVAKPS
jgi:GNAT superfamily N-acetyltransferase